MAEVGPGVDDLQAGQRVWGHLGTRAGRTGAAADYLLAGREQVAVEGTAVVGAQKKPPGLCGVQVRRYLHCLKVAHSGGLEPPTF
ncbi:hypothetical protein [Nocardiopsis sp. CNR-923]|uniref:hypothetical protein n=1 Tax=Nocardiopsis sp. CNR-923 TaxID=1904965 RepID=UPI00373FD9DB